MTRTKRQAFITTEEVHIKNKVKKKEHQFVYLETCKKKNIKLYNRNRIKNILHINKYKWT